MVIGAIGTLGSFRRLAMTFKSWVLVLALGAVTAAGCKASSSNSGSQPPAHDPSLQDLVVAGDAATAMLPYYDRDTHLYDVILSSALTTATVTATPADAAVRTVTVAQLGVGTATVPGGTAVPFAVPDAGGTSTVRVVSTTPDGKASAGYTLAEDVSLRDLTVWLPPELVFGAPSPYLHGKA